MNFTLVNSNVTGAVNYLDRLIPTLSNNLIVIVLGITINYISATMVHTFNTHHIFKSNPRFILFIHLLCNDMIQLTTSISLFILSYISRAYVYICCLLILPAILTTQNNPLNIAAMALECYIAVCIPLRYNLICTVKRTYIVIGIIWILSSLTVLPDVFILFATEPLEFINSKVTCFRDTVFRSNYSLKKRDASHILFLVVVWLTLIYTYIRIMFVAKAAEADTKKAKNTILLQGFQVLLSMIVYVGPMLLEVLTYVFPQSLRAIHLCVFIIIQVCPRITSPIIFGLRDKTFRKYAKRYLLCTVTMNIRPKIIVK